MQEMATMVNEANAAHQQPNDEELNLMENGHVHGMEMIGPTQTNWPNHLLPQEGHQQVGKWSIWQREKHQFI
jgi:hypothetical protein